MTSPTSSEILAELGALKTFFTTAQKELENGKVTSMVGLDRRISTVCQQVQQVIPQEQEKYLPELTILIELLNNYEDGLKNFQALQLAEAAKIAVNDDES